MKRFFAWCGVILLPAVVLGGLCTARRDPAQPNRVLPTQMALSPAQRIEVANPALARAMVVRPPVPGTLARGAHPFHYANTDADRARAGKELINPFEATPQRLAEGRRLYETYCLVCHGTSGGGDGPLIPKFPNPPNFRSPRLKALRDGEIFHTITLGRKKMKSHAALLSWDERWLVILYIRSLQEGRR